MINYDLIRLLEHPLKFRNCIPSAIAILGRPQMGHRSIQVAWKRSSTDVVVQDELLLSWDIAVLRSHIAELEEEIEILRHRDEDRATKVELTAVVVAVAVMSHLEPQARFTRRSRIGTSHDYYLNDDRDEMIEVAGRWRGGLPGLFAEKRRQSEQNHALRKRWVSVTIIESNPRNRTEGLHP